LKKQKIFLCGIKMLENGTICVKTCGRDAGKIAVIIDQIDSTYVLIDGEVRRRKCNRLHLEPLGKKIKLKPNSSTAVIIDELKKLEINVKKSKSKASAQRLRKQRKIKNIPEENKKERKGSKNKDD